MVDARGQVAGRGADDARHVAAGVDDHVPAPLTQRRQPAVPVAVNLLHVGVEVRVRLTAVEESDRVAGGAGLVH